MTLKFKNRYSSRKTKPEFFVKYKENEQVTDKSQIAGASIVEMAKRFGIEAIIAKAEQTKVENSVILDKLYGHDLTNGFKSKDEMLNIKRKISNVFENIPARIRKEVFADDPVNFVNAFTTNDETRLEQLNKLGIVSTTQLESVKKYNNQIKLEKQEQAKKEQFIQLLNRQQEGLYENFKQTGNIAFNNNNNITEGNTNVQNNLQ